MHRKAPTSWLGLFVFTLLTSDQKLADAYCLSRDCHPLRRVETDGYGQRGLGILSIKATHQNLPANHKKAPTSWLRLFDNHYTIIQ